MDRRAVNVPMTWPGCAKRCKLGANAGGLDELLIPNPETQVLLTGVFGVNPPF
jgi:hypothetical protein